jgi:hypothetical protein
MPVGAAHDHDWHACERLKFFHRGGNALEIDARATSQATSYVATNAWPTCLKLRRAKAIHSSGVSLGNCARQPAQDIGAFLDVLGCGNLPT